MPSAVLVGREAELAVVDDLVQAAGRGAGGALLVVGEAGIGKSRLLDEAAERAAARGMAVLSGRAVDGSGSYRAIAQALAGRLRHGGLGAYADLPDLRPYGAALARLLPGWSGGTAGPEPSVDPVLVLGEGLLRLLRAIGAEGGCLLRLEDLHRADDDTVALVQYLAESAAGSRLLLAVSARDDLPAGRVADRVAPLPGVTTVHLHRLADAAVVALTTALAGPDAVPDDVRDAVVERADGLPFLVEELLAGLREDGGAGRPSVPPSFAALVGARLETLAPGERAVVEAAAVIGSDPDPALLATVVGADDGAVVAALRAASAVNLLVAAGGTLRWRHALTRDAVLAQLLPPERAAYARRAADAVSARLADADDEALAAELYTAAGEADRAAEILVRLARRDLSRGALRSAETLLRRAGRTGRGGTALAVERVRLLTLSGRSAEALDVGDAALAAATGEAHAELCLQLARTAVLGGRWAEAVAYVERAGRPDDPRSLVLLADAAHGAGAPDEAARLAVAAVALAERSTRPETLCAALTIRARLAARSDSAAAALDFRRAAQIAAEHGLAPARVEALSGLGTIELVDRADSPALHEAREQAVDAGLLAQVAGIDLLLTDGVALVAGPRAAIPVARAAAGLAGGLRLSALQATCELLLAGSLALSGDAAGMEQVLAGVAAHEHAPVEAAALAPVARGLVPLLAHDLARANALLDEGMAILLAHPSAAPVAHWGLWAVLRTAVADRDQEARDTLRAAPAVLRAVNRAGLAYADAIAAGRAGEPQRAAELFGVADRLVREHHWWRRMLRLLALECAVADGWGDPVPALRADLAAHEAAGDDLLARTCRDLLRRAGAPTRRGRGATPVGPSLRAVGVTSREMDVLTLVADGLSNAEVAQRLFLSPRTVETHVASLLAKTGASSRTQLRRWAVAQTP